MDETQANAMIAALERQRNEALNDAVRKAAMIAVLVKERDALRAKLEELLPPVEQPTA